MKKTSKKVEKKSKKNRRSLGEQRAQWFSGISDRLSKRCTKNVSKIDKDISRVKGDKEAVKKLTDIKNALIQAGKLLKA